MATEPDSPQPAQHTRVERVVDAVVSPVADAKSRPLYVLAVAAFCAALAPFPVGGIAAAALVLVAAELARKR